jgi:hypothetical protein
MISDGVHASMAPNATASRVVIDCSMTGDRSIGLAVRTKLPILSFVPLVEQRISPRFGELRHLFSADAQSRLQGVIAFACLFLAKL